MLPAIRTNGSAKALSPSTPLTTIFDQFDRFFENAFAPLSARPAWDSFPMSMWEDDEAIHIELDAPGVAEKDIEVTVHDGKLIVRWERKAEEKKGGYDTRAYGWFERRINLPSPVDTEKVEAKLANGVLRVTCPKSEAAKPRKIAIATPQPKKEE